MIHRELIFQCVVQSENIDAVNKKDTENFVNERDIAAKELRSAFKADVRVGIGS